MTFQSKRLRVQLPCADTSLVDEVGPVVPATFCPMPSRVPVAAHPACGFFSCAPDSLGPFTGGPWPDLCGGTLICGGATNAGHDEFETVLVSPEQLTVLRRQLEARLALVTGAEKALARNAAVETEAGDV